MPAPYSRVAVFSVMCALIGCFLLIADLGERPSFDRVVVELLLIAALPVWLLGRRLRLRH